MNYNAYVRLFAYEKQAQFNNCLLVILYLMNNLRILIYFKKKRDQSETVDLMWIPLLN